MNNNKVLGMMRITENGLCSHCDEFNEAKKKYDPQIISGFFYALSKFSKDFLGEDITEIKSQKYKILFKKQGNDLLIYMVDEEFNDYSILQSKNSASSNLILAGITS